MRRSLLSLVAAALATIGLLPATSHAAVAFAPCTSAAAIECATVSVPLDRTGAFAGTVALHVERSLPPTGAPRGVMLLVAGGPGQPGSATFGLAQNAAAFRTLFPGYALATFDIRGTGASAPLSCPALQSLLSAADVQRSAQLIGECGTLLGDARRFYQTRDHADDLDAVRQALGVDKIGIWGTSYGTKLAETYALMYPEHVERLLLDSVVPPEGHDAFRTDALRAMPGALAQICEGTRCSAVTRDFPGEVAALANRLAAKPLSGKVLVAKGPARTVRLDGVQFLSLVVEADLNPGVAAELPAAVHAALRGEPRPLLRLELLVIGAALPADSLNLALYAATVCDDGGFPWQPDAPVDVRQALNDAAVAALPPGSTGPFGAWATNIGDGALCKLWPAQPVRAAAAIRPLPDVPVLVLNGGRDTRTPATGASAVASRFPHARLIVVPGVGHSVLGADVSGCAVRAVRAWMSGADPGQCARPSDIVTPIGAFPSSFASLGRTGRLPAKVARTVTAVVRTTREAGAIWVTSALGLGESQGAIAGVYGGRLVPGPNGFTLLGYSIVPGVALTGPVTVDTTDWLFPFHFTGIVTVNGKKAATGRVKVDRRHVQGQLGGRALNVAIG